MQINKILSIIISTFILVLTLSVITNSQNYLPIVPDSLRGDVDWERLGQHDANNIRTRFWSYGMAGDYPRDPINVDLTVFHSMEWPKGSGENYSDGHTPYVLSKIRQTNGNDAYLMFTGYRERQARSPLNPERIMRFEPRPGYFEADVNINVNRSPALSHDSRTWPAEWIDKLNDMDDPGWSGSWNGYFGKAPGADQESFVVYDDNYYDAWNFFPDSRDMTRRGLALKVEQRGFQWANPQAGDVLFWHYDITNEGTTKYDNNMIFGIYLDSGVGGSSVGVDNVPESDDDNASFVKTIGLNVVYTWDVNGNGVRGKTGYLGYSYLETPGNGTDFIDNDLNGIVDELRDSGPGQLITGQENIKAWVEANYDILTFEEFFQGPLETRPAYQQGFWWTGDEDMDWVAEFHDTGADGVFADENNEPDTGENDGIPTFGEPNFDKTDVDESDQIGLTGFKMNRIKAGAGAPPDAVDGIVFYTSQENWPERLYEKFTSNDPFDLPLVQNYNIGFLFASGTFVLDVGKTERFSLAQGFGRNLRELENTLRVVSQIYKANYRFAVPPPVPALTAYEGDGFVTLTWDDRAERGFDPITLKNDFEGYRIYRSTDPTFLDPQVVYTATGSRPIGNGKPIAQFDLKNGIYGFSEVDVEGVAYFLGDETGLTHSYTDHDVINGQNYFYAITAYDHGSDSLLIYPSENAISVSQTLRGGIILAKNVVQVRPNKPVVGFKEAEITSLQHSAGGGSGTVSIKILNSELVPDNHEFRIGFTSHEDSIHAEFYNFVDITSGDTLFSTGNIWNGEETGISGKGIIPIVTTPDFVEKDPANSGFTESSNATVDLSFTYNSGGLPINLKREGYPADLEIIFSDQAIDTSKGSLFFPGIPTKFKIIAKTNDGDKQLDFKFTDVDGDSTLGDFQDVIQVLTYAKDNPTKEVITWRIKLDTTNQASRGAIVLPGNGDVYNLKLSIPFSSEDEFTFFTQGWGIDSDSLKNDIAENPYVVPNPYVGAASFEPQRFAVSGRGERRIEFRNIANNSVIRIYTVTGELVKTLRHDGNINKGIVAWDLRTKDNLEIAPGLYIFHVEADDVDSFIGKFAIVK
jgi:hypothetical protein